MSYVILSHVATGDLATAALHNTLLDDIAIIKSNINDDGTLNPFIRWKTASGQSTATTTNVSLDSVAMGSPTALDWFEVDVSITVGAGISGGTGLTLRHLGDNANICNLFGAVTLTAGETVTGKIRLSQDHSSATLINILNVSNNNLHTSPPVMTTFYTATAIWGSNWVLSLNMNSQSSGTTHWHWRVTKHAGQ